MKYSQSPKESDKQAHMAPQRKSNAIPGGPSNNLVILSQKSVRWSAIRPPLWKIVPAAQQTGGESDYDGVEVEEIHISSEPLSEVQHTCFIRNTRIFSWYKGISLMA